MAGTSPKITKSDGVASQSRSKPNESSRKTPARTTAHHRTREGKDSSVAVPKSVTRPDSLFDAIDSSEDDMSNNLSEQSIHSMPGPVINNDLDSNLLQHDIYNSSLSQLVQEFPGKRD
jgi:hypothetical protein